MTVAWISALATLRLGHPGQARPSSAHAVCVAGGCAASRSSCASADAIARALITGSAEGGTLPTSSCWSGWALAALSSSAQTPIAATLTLIIGPRGLTRWSEWEALGRYHASMSPGDGQAVVCTSSRDAVATRAMRRPSLRDTVPVLRAYIDWRFTPALLTRLGGARRRSAARAIDTGP